MKFHEKLLELRKNANMTQNDLADKLNVSRQAVSRWEMGTAMPDVDNLIAMSDLFGVSLDYLLKDQVPQKHVASARWEAPLREYWSFVPKKWWVLAVAAVVARLLPQLCMMFLFGMPSVSGVIHAGGIITLCNIVSSASLLGLVSCFIWAFLKWKKLI